MKKKAKASPRKASKPAAKKPAPRKRKAKAPPPRPRAPVGRPTAYALEFAEQAKKLCTLGATDLDLADFFHVSINTIGNWKTRYPEFLEALKEGKDPADDRVQRSLFQRAVGYTYDAVKIIPPKAWETEPLLVPYREHVPPDTTACIFWLKNRRKEEWRDKAKSEDGKGGDAPAQPIDPATLKAAGSNVVPLVGTLDAIRAARRGQAS